MDTTGNLVADAPHQVFDLSIDMLNNEFNTLAIGSKRTLRDDMMEEGRVVLSKVAENILKVRVYVFQPKIDQPGDEGTYEAYKGTYRYVPEF